MTKSNNIYQSELSYNNKKYQYADIQKFAHQLGGDLAHLPYSIRILLEDCLRNAAKNGFSIDNAKSVLSWNPEKDSFRTAIPFLPARVLLQDFTGLPVLNDLTALRAAVSRDGKDPQKVNPRIPTNLIIDHSLQVSAHGYPEARLVNEELEFEQNAERYQFLKWSQESYDNLKVLPPGLGICHQVNLEFLGKVAFTNKLSDERFSIYPDSVLGTDSHTTMINGMGILGWGVGGIEALAALLEYPSEFPIPDVIGVRLIGALPKTATPTDLTLTLTAKLREMGVVGKFVEVFGESASQLPVETRAMVSNMSPESGATMTYFPVDEQTIQFLIRTGRSEEHAGLVREYFHAQKLFRNGEDNQITYSDMLEFDLSKVEPVLSGPKRPHDTFSFSTAKSVFQSSLIEKKGLHGFGLSEEQLSTSAEVKIDNKICNISHGTILIAAIASCTNTSDPYVMIAAGLLAKNAVEKGLRCKPWVKTSLAPGSRIVKTYLERANLLSGLNTLGFNIVGYGCTTCIGNSGPINPDIEKVVTDNNLITAGILSGNRNFEGRIHHITQANFLASPPLVISYALAGNMTFNFKKDTLGIDKNGNPVFLMDIYPSSKEIQETIENIITGEMYTKNYADIYTNNQRWNDLPFEEDTIFRWDNTSTLIREPEFLFDGFVKNGSLSDIKNAYALSIFGDSVTTDHISPAGRIAHDNPAATYLTENRVEAKDYISFGVRRGNHEVMARGTLSNPRIQNKLAGGKEGGFTTHFPSSEITTIYDAAQRYIKDDIPLIIIAGKAYGTGSSRDWAAKGTYLLGVQAVIAESFERIHRTNLVCMGILPLQFEKGENAESLNLAGSEHFTIKGIRGINNPNTEINVSVQNADGSMREFSTVALINTPLEFAYFKAGGLMRKLRADF